MATHSHARFPVGFVAAIAILAAPITTLVSAKNSAVESGKNLFNKVAQTETTAKDKAPQPAK